MPADAPSDCMSPVGSGTVKLWRPRRFGDTRGWFMETYSEARALDFGIAERFVQDNHSYSATTGTVRGLHFQRPPRAQAKLVRCVRGAIMDFAVDIRRGSPTYGRFVTAMITAEAGEQIYVPPGFAHGFVTLGPDVEVIYKVSDVYSPECDGGLLWNDPDIGIDWPLPARGGPVLSDKDKALPRLAGFESPFPYDGRPMQLVEIA